MTPRSAFHKGIVLAGGAGTRLHPTTKVVSKQLLPVYDKPMVYYALSTLIEAGIREILLISTPKDVPLFERLLGGGTQLGLRITYAAQPRPEGIAQAFQIGRDFIEHDNVALILGDNIFHGGKFAERLAAAAARPNGATIFVKPIRDPRRYGVLETDASGRPVGIQEKPGETGSKLAVTGLYFYDNQVVDIAASLSPSARNELEITDVNQAYLERGALHVEELDTETAWFDVGTHESYLAAANFVEMVQTERNAQIGAIEEAAFQQGLITAEQLLALAQQCDNNYAQYLRDSARAALRTG